MLVDYGRFDGRFAFAFMFVFESLLAFVFIFELRFVETGVDAIVGAGVGVLRFTFELFALLVAASPHAIPSVPSVKTVASAIFFIIPDDLLSSSKSLILPAAEAALLLSK